MSNADKIKVEKKGHLQPPPPWEVLTYHYFDLATNLGCIHLPNTCKDCDNTCKNCGNTHEYWAYTWKMWSPASATFASISTILLNFEAILERFSVRINFKSQFQSNDLQKALKYLKIASKLTSILTILANIALAGEHIFQVLAQYLWVLPQYLRVLSQYSQVLSRWIHPRRVTVSLNKSESYFRLVDCSNALRAWG